MNTTYSVLRPEQRKASDYIRQRPAGNFHHAIRLAESKGLKLNLFVSLNFALTACPAEKAASAFKQVRTSFGKWITRPRKKKQRLAVAPTFVWVIENPDNLGCLNAHWLIHVPSGRKIEFRSRLAEWLRTAAGEVQSEKAIDIKRAHNPKGAGRYMLKGMYPTVARDFLIEPSYQGWVTGKRIGHSKNLGPVQLDRMRKQGKHPPASRWIHGKYGKTTRHGFANIPAHRINPGQRASEPPLR